MRACFLVLICFVGLSGTANALPFSLPPVTDSNVLKVECGSEGPYCHYGTYRACPGPDYYGRMDCDCAPCAMQRRFYQPRYAPPPPQYYTPRRRDYYSPY
jgi:hypothetical protein